MTPSYSCYAVTGVTTTRCSIITGDTSNNTTGSVIDTTNINIITTFTSDGSVSDSNSYIATITDINTVLGEKYAAAAFKSHFFEIQPQ